MHFANESTLPQQRFMSAEQQIIVFLMYCHHLSHTYEALRDPPLKVSHLLSPFTSESWQDETLSVINTVSHVQSVGSADFDKMYSHLPKSEVQ